MAASDTDMTMHAKKAGTLQIERPIVGSLTSSSQRLRVQAGPSVTFMVSLPGLGDQWALRSRLVSSLLLLLESIH